MFLEVQFYDGQNKNKGKEISLSNYFNGIVFEKVFIKFEVVFDVVFYYLGLFIGVGDCK